MFIRLIGFVRQLADEPAAPDADPALAMFTLGRSIAETTSALVPGLAGPALVIGQRSVEQDIRNLVIGQDATIAQQQETIDRQAERIEELEERIHQLLLRIEQMRRREAAQQQHGG